MESLIGFHEILVLSWFQGIGLGKRRILGSVSILIDITDNETDSWMDRCVDVAIKCFLSALLALQTI